MRKTIFCTILSLLFSFATFASSNLTIEYLSGEEKTEAISAIGKLTFKGDNMQLLSKTDEVLAETSLSAVKKIVFSDQTTGAPSIRSYETIVVYPNPTDDKIFIKGAENEQFVRVFDLNGSLLISEKTSSLTEIDVKKLSKGEYLLQIGTEVVKFIKK